MTLWIIVPFWLVALGASVFYGARARDVHVAPGKDSGDPYKDLKPAYRVHQFWFNFAGSFAGWCAVWAMNPAACLRSECTANLTWGSAALAVVAFAGVTGHLPAIFARLVTNLAGLFALLSKWLTGALEDWLKAKR